MFDRALSLLAPTPPTRSLDWFREHIFTHEEKSARPYDERAYPHLGAPGGPCDAFDEEKVRNVWLQFASRLGKTFFGQCCQLFTAAVHPAPMMFASASEKLAKEVVARTYGMLGNCDALRDQLRPVNRRKDTRIDLASCRLFVGWARSISTLADKGVKCGHAGELDKWEHQSTSKEADPAKLFADRGKEHPARKFIWESTPAVRKHSRIEAGRLASTNCRYHVPCPHCRRYQVLKFGDGKTPGGIKWDTPEGQHSDPDAAKRTARYVCEHCERDIQSHHRATMMRRGVWCPEGCTVDDAKAAEAIDEGYQWFGWRHAAWIVGTPARDGADAGYQLSSLYALALDWGDIAAEFVRCKNKPQDFRNFVNQWLGETWEIHRQQQTWEQLGTRVIASTPRSIIPAWAVLLTAGIDRQQDHFAYVVDAWGSDKRCQTIQYGETDEFGELLQTVISAQFLAENNLPQRAIVFTLIDSGYRPEGVYEFCADCQAHRLNVFPAKGSSTALNADFRLSVLGENTSHPGAKLFHVDTLRTQGWIDRQLHKLSPDEPGGYSLHAGSLLEHQDFLEQLLNDAPILDLDRNNNNRESWQRIDDSIPNDFRDCRRYAHAAMLIATHGQPIVLQPAKTQKRKRRVVSGGGRRADGRPWI